MCTLILLRRLRHDWPLLVAANRDEMRDRPWAAPAQHWPDRPGVVAGLDRLAGGSWLGINRHGVMAAMLNRAHSLGPAPNKLSRGLLVLDALGQASAAAAAESLRPLDFAEYRPFNMVVADAEHAFWLRNDGTGYDIREIDAGVSILTAHEINDVSDARIEAFLPRFRDAAPPNPDQGDWRNWQALLAERSDQGNGRAGLNFETGTGFGTRSSALLALPKRDDASRHPVFLFAAGPPDRAPWDKIAL